MIISVDDWSIRKPSDVVSAVQLHRPGEAVLLGIRRDGKTNSVVLSLPEWKPK